MSIVIYDASNIKHVERLAGRLWEEFADGSDKAWIGRENFIDALCKVADMVTNGTLNRDKNAELKAALNDSMWLRRALVKAAFALHSTPIHQLPEGMALVDNNEVRVRVDGNWVVARIRRE